MTGEYEYPPACTAVLIERLGTVSPFRRCVSVKGSQSRTTSRGSILGGDDLRAETVRGSTEGSSVVAIFHVARLGPTGNEVAWALKSRRRCLSSWMMRALIGSAGVRVHTQAS